VTRGDQHIYVLNGSSWSEVSTADPDSSNPLPLSSVLGVGPEIFACANFDGSSRPVYRYDGAKFVSTGAAFGAEAVFGVSASNVWAFSSKQATRWNGSSWEPSISTLAGCAFGVAAGASDLTCVGSGLSDSPFHFDGTSWTKVPLPAGGWVNGLATHAGKTWALSSAGQRPTLAGLDPATKTWSSKTIDPVSGEPREVDPAPGAGVLSDGRLVIGLDVVDRSGHHIDKSYLAIGPLP
jgi:hypothetical protein